MSKRSSIGQYLIYVLLIIIILLIIYPLLVTLNTSLKKTRDIITKPFSLPKEPQFINYKNALTKGNLLTCYKNSFIITLSTLVLALAFGSMASYVFAKHIFQGKNVLFFYMISGMMIPVAILFIPLFKMLTSLNLYNTRFGMVLVYTAKSLPFAIFILTDFIRTIHNDLFESAEIDGASEFHKFSYISLPLTLPALATVAIFIFRDVWNDYFLPLIFLRDPEIQTLQVGLSRFMGQFMNQWGMLYAGLNMVVFPLLIMYYILSKQFLLRVGITSGAVKE
jgi:raffinose/stachyose/melibiose transport system permease protein